MSRTSGSYWRRNLETGTRCGTKINMTRGWSTSIYKSYIIKKSCGITWYNQCITNKSRRMSPCHHLTVPPTAITTRHHVLDWSRHRCDLLPPPGSWNLEPVSGSVASPRHRWWEVSLGYWHWSTPLAYWNDPPSWFWSLTLPPIVSHPTFRDGIGFLSTFGKAHTSAQNLTRQ